MNRLLVRCAMAAVFFCSIVGQVRAGAIYSQLVPTPPLGAYSSIDTAIDQKVADNFVFNAAGSVTVRSLRFVGGYVTRNPPPSTPPLDTLPTDNFRVVLFTDAAGIPGLPIPDGDFHVGAPVLRTPTGGPLLNGVDTPLEYVLDLGPGITLSPTTVYWVSIVNYAGPNNGWVWARAAGVFDQQVAATMGDFSTGPWSVGTSGGMYFVLNDNNVPEPTSLGILLLTALGMLWARATRSSLAVMNAAVNRQTTFHQ